MCRGGEAALFCIALVQRRYPQGWAGGQVGGAGVRQLSGCVAQGGAQAFFQRGVVERHAQKIMHGQLLLHGQGQQVGEVLAIRGAQLGTQQATTRVVGINAQASLVALRCAVRARPWLA